MVYACGASAVAGLRRSPQLGDAQPHEDDGQHQCVTGAKTVKMAYGMP
jgi:hypothetical protein